MPTFESIVIRRDELDANPPIPLKPDWDSITRELRRWAEAGQSFPNHRVHYWRQLFREFCLISYNAGTRPQELFGAKETKRIQQWDGTYKLLKTSLVGFVGKILRRMRPPTTPVRANRLHSRTPSAAAKQANHEKCHPIPASTSAPACDGRRYRRENNLPPLTPKDYVFFNRTPTAAMPQWQKSWDRLVTHLGNDSNPVRTDLTRCGPCAAATSPTRLKKVKTST